MSISQLIKYKVDDNRDERERKEKQNKIKLHASLLAAAINGNDVEGKGRGKSKGRGGCGGIMQGRGPQKRTPLGLNQCAVCEQEGHRKNECLKREGPKERDHAENANLVIRFRQ